LTEGFFILLPIGGSMESSYHVIEKLLYTKVNVVEVGSRSVTEIGYRLRIYITGSGLAE
jgi:hypothetical protein